MDPRRGGGLPVASGGAKNEKGGAGAKGGTGWAAAPVMHATGGKARPCAGERAAGAPAGVR
ncbi:hypothetical protein ACX84U_29490, partial [Burkholderia pseudomallei]